jgi:hypothetical protein
MTKNGNLEASVSEAGQIRKRNENPKERETIFILCDTCFWCATYFGNLMVPAEDRCPNCLDTELSSFPILCNESFTFDYNEKRGVELNFDSRKKK